MSVTFDLYPDPPTGYLNKNGYIRVKLSDDNDNFLDIGNVSLLNCALVVYDRANRFRIAHFVPTLLSYIM